MTCWLRILALLGCVIATPAEAASGLASVISHQTRTASGERYRGNDMVAAHRSLPFGTRVKVSHGSRSVVVRIVDRGPFVQGRVLDLSYAAARHLGMLRAGVSRVIYEVVK